MVGVQIRCFWAFQLKFQELKIKSHIFLQNQQGNFTHIKTTETAEHIARSEYINEVTIQGPNLCVTPLMGFKGRQRRQKCYIHIKISKAIF